MGLRCQSGLQDRRQRQEVDQGKEGMSSCCWGRAFDRMLWNWRGRMAEFCDHNKNHSSRVIRKGCAYMALGKSPCCTA